MTALEQLQALAFGEVPEIRYAPVDRLKALAMLIDIENRQTTGETATSFYKALEDAAACLNDEADGE